MAGRSPQPTKVQRDVEPSKGVVQSSRFVKSAALGITGGTSVKNDALIKGEQEKSRRARRSCTASRTLLCQSAPSGDAPETMDARDVRQNRVGPAFCVCEGGPWPLGKSSLRAGRLSTSRSVIATSASTTAPRWTQRYSGERTSRPAPRIFRPATRSLSFFAACLSKQCGWASLMEARFSRARMGVLQRQQGGRPAERRRDFQSQ